MTGAVLTAPALAQTPPKPNILFVLIEDEEQRDWWTPPLKLGSAKAFDLITDPKEEYPATALRNSWIAGPAIAIADELEQSLKRYPPIALGTPDPYTPPRSSP